MLVFSLTMVVAMTLSPYTDAADCVDTLVNTPTAGTLVQLVTRAGLATALKQGTVTIFAPTNDAFNLLPQVLQMKSP